MTRSRRLTQMTHRFTQIFFVAIRDHLREPVLTSKKV